MITIRNSQVGTSWRTTISASLFVGMLTAVMASGCGNNAPIVSTPVMPARDLNIAGLHAFHEGRLDLAEDYFRQSIAACEAIDHRKGKADSLYNLALVHRARNKLDLASKELKSAQLLFRRMSDDIGMARSVTALATIEVSRGRDQSALLLIERALPGAPRSVRSEMLIELASIHLAQGEYATARSRAEAAISGASSDMVRADALFIMARVELASGSSLATKQNLEAALELDRKQGRRRQIAETLRFLARVAEKEGDHEKAEDYLQRAVGVDRSLGIVEDED